MKKVVSKISSILLSTAMAIAMIPFSSNISFAETQAVTNDVKYFTTTMYNFDGNAFNKATTSKYGRDTEKNFYFIGSKADVPNNRGAVSKYNGEKYLVQGIVENKLINGQIVFTDNARNIGVFAPNTETVAGRTVYENVQFPFNYNNGYYEFNGKSNHVHMSEYNSNKKSLTLYKDGQNIGGNTTFFPFNNDDDSNPDYHFGMSMSVPFYMTSNGKDKNGKDIQFNFSGDDDVWVFINGKLVLDIGGIHGDIAASINFATGNITYKYAGDKDSNKDVNGTNLSRGSLTTSTTLQNLGINMSDLAKGENNLQIYYLERGAGLSNCKIGFNLPQKDTLEISKELGKNTPYTTSDFKFKVLHDGKEYSNASYRLYTGNVLDPNENYKTDSNGEFSIKAGQHINFVDNPTGDYQVIELTEGYETSWLVEKEGNSIGSNIKDKNGITYTVTSGEDGAATKYTVNCINSADVTLNDDSIVLDYGKPVKYNVRDNDNDSSKSASVYGVGKGELPKYVTTATGYTTLDRDTELSNGNIKIDKDGIVTYTPTKYMSTIDKANYAVSYKLPDNKTTRYAYATVNIIPATSVYYEDDFGGNENNNNPNVAIVWSKGWSTATSAKTENTYQDSSNGLYDGENGYGWDSSYKNDIGFSNGSAHYSSKKLASATFRFKGTGVDVYSRTNDGVGKIIATLKKVTKNENGTESLKTIKNVGIDNLSVSGDYYQIPTLNFDGLDYATYEVTIKVVPVLNSDKTVKRATYYLDGIRVYNPLGKVDANSTAGKAYEEAGESNAQYIQVRKDLLDSSKVQAIDTAIKGSLFIDKSEDTVGDRSDSIGTYKEYGPKNEVYLKEDQGVAFTINNYNSNKNKVFIGLKSPTGKNVTVKITTGSKYTTKTISSAADLYYELTPTSDGKVVIENTTDNLLSITKVRITTKNSINGVSANYSLTSSPELMSYVNTFDTLQEEQDTTQKDTLDKGDVDIDNPSDNNTNTDNDKQDNSNQQTQSNNIWNKIMSSIKGWFRR